MNTELARDLQCRITKEALAMLVIHGSAAETKDYERAIILIGSASVSYTHLDVYKRQEHHRLYGGGGTAASAHERL